jgi:hypothetical protein
MTPFHTKEDEFQCHISLCGICGGRSFIWAGNLVLLSQTSFHQYSVSISLIFRRMGNVPQFQEKF